MSAPSLSLLRAVSRHAGRLLDSRPGLEAESAALLGQPFGRAELEAFLAPLAGAWQESADEDALNRALRQLKSRVWTRTAARDIAGLASLEEVTAAFSGLAEISIRAAQVFYTRELAERHGQPLHPDGSPMQLVVTAWASWGGGNECFLRHRPEPVPEEGQTTGAQRCSCS